MASSEPHILLIGGDGAPSGVPRQITALVKALRDRARITVISEANRGGYDEIAGLGAEHVILEGLSSGLDPRTWRAGRAALASCLAARPADLVWAHARMPVVALRQILAAQDWTPPAATRVAVSYHGLPFGRGHRPGTSALTLRMERRLSAACPPLDLVFLTESQRQKMTAALGPAMTHHDSHVLSNASHLGQQDKSAPAPDVLPARPAGRHIVMTGRAGWQKNHAEALRLMRHLPEDITLSLCGDGTDSPRYAALARRLAGAASARLRLLGPLPDVRPLLEQADGYMLTSRYEGQPIGAIEACEYGLPLILSDFDEAAALVEGHPMALRLKGTRPAQGQAIDRLLTRYLDDREANRMAITEFWAARHAPKRFAAQARAVVETILDKG